MIRILGADKEKRLLRLFDRGDASAMDRLYAEYADYLAGVCYRYVGNDDDMKDVLQEAFIKIFTRIGSFEYRGKGSLKAWMTRIVVNESLTFLRRNAAAAETPITGDTPDTADDTPATEGIDAAAVMEMVARLPEGYRVVFNLFAIEGMSHKAIADELGITPSTSASQFFKAKRMLARMINEYRRKNG